MPKIALYSAVGPELTLFHLNSADGSLTRKSSFRMPSRVQYMWRHPRLPVWYITTAIGGPRQPSDINHLSAWRMRADGTLQSMGEPWPLPARAVHLCADRSGRYVLNAYNYPRQRVTVHATTDDGSLSSEIAQSDVLDYGIYPHQIMTLPSGRHALIVDRGNQPTANTPEEPGALRTYAMRDGVLSEGQVVAPNGGYGFGPRHVDFHPSQPWLYVSDERYNSLHMFRMQGDRIEETPAYTVRAMADPDHVTPRQMGGPIHVHPDGRTVYVVNRADDVVERNGRLVSAGGENNVAVFRIDPSTGEPKLVQHADTRSFHVRTFTIDPTGKFLVTASNRPMEVDNGAAGIEHVPAAMTVFRIDGGRLEFLHRHAVDTPDGESQYWVGAAELSA
jgi:6-phosphogluconolactonase (cycloisomerase 2 family)